MVRKSHIGLGLLAALTLSACGSLTPTTGDPNGVIAVAEDRGWFGKGPLPNQRAAIAYDPDGCQNWIIDDGIEGYSSPRFDPATGMANVCNKHFPPGAVVGYHQSPKSSMRDWIPG